MRSARRVFQTRLARGGVRARIGGDPPGCRRRGAPAGAVIRLHEVTTSAATRSASIHLDYHFNFCAPGTRARFSTSIPCERLSAEAAVGARGSGRRSWGSRSREPKSSGNRKRPPEAKPVEEHRGSTAA